MFEDRRRQLLAALTAFALIFSIVAVTSVPLASAYPQDPFNCNGSISIYPGGGAIGAGHVDLWASGYADGIQNPNSSSVNGSYVLLKGTSMTTLTTSWKSITSSWENPSNTDGVQMQVSVYGKSTSFSGGNGSVRLDNVRDGGI